MVALVGLAALLTTQIQASEVELAAMDAGVAAVDLRGAMNSTGLGAYQYLWSVGELEPPTPVVKAEPPVGVWDRLAACEAGGVWSNASNPIYKGGLQFDAQTWARHGGLAFAARADYATRAQQIEVGRRTQAAQGWGAWPVCSRRLGLR